MNIEEMQQKMREIEEQNQEQFMSELRERVENLAQKAVKKDYIPTDKERIDFVAIYKIISDMNNWF